MASDVIWHVGDRVYYHADSVDSGGAVASADTSDTSAARPPVLTIVTSTLPHAPYVACVRVSAPASSASDAATDDVDEDTTRWVWASQLTAAVPREEHRLFITSLADLRVFGKWSAKHAAWERRWTMPSGDVVRVLEDPTVAESDGEGALWPGAIVLSRLLCVDTTLQEQLRVADCVLELGAGLGLASIVAAHYCSYVLATDTKAGLGRLNRNIEANFGSCPGATAVVPYALEWSDTASIPPKYPNIILCTDLLYNAGKLGILATTLRRLLTPTHGFALFVQDDESTPGTTAVRKKFFETACSGAFVVTDVDLTSVVGPEWTSPAIHCFKLTLKS